MVYRLEKIRRQKRELALITKRAKMCAKISVTIVVLSWIGIIVWLWVQ